MQVRGPSANNESIELIWLRMKSDEQAADFQLLLLSISWGNTMASVYCRFKYSFRQGTRRPALYASKAFVRDMALIVIHAISFANRI